MIEISAGFILAKLAKNREAFDTSLMYYAKVYLEKEFSDYGIFVSTDWASTSNAIAMSSGALAYQQYIRDYNIIVNPTFTLKPLSGCEFFFVQSFDKSGDKKSFAEKLENINFSSFKTKEKNMVIQKNIYNYAGKPLPNYSLDEIIKIKEVLSHKDLDKKLIIEGVILSEYIGALDFAIKKYEFNSSIKEEELFLKKVLF